MKKNVILGALILTSILVAPGKAVAASTNRWDWKKINSNTVTTDKMTHNLTTYKRYAQSTDHCWGKVEGIHTPLKKDGSTRGYVRIRFEGLFGSVCKGTDSGRIWGYGYSTAETPEPFNGLAYLRAYCGD